MVGGHFGLVFEKVECDEEDNYLACFCNVEHEAGSVEQQAEHEISRSDPGVVVVMALTTKIIAIFLLVLSHHWPVSHGIYFSCKNGLRIEMALFVVHQFVRIILQCTFARSTREPCGRRDVSLFFRLREVALESSFRSTNGAR